MGYGTEPSGHWKEEDLMLFEQGYSNQEIHKMTGRSYNAIKQERRHRDYLNREVQFWDVLDTWHKKNLERYRKSLHKGDEVKVIRKVYKGASDATVKIEDKAIVMEVYPDIVVTNKGHFQIKELLRWRIGGDFV